MANKQKHMERSRYSHHKKVDYSGFIRKANLKTAKKTQKGLVESFFGMFKRGKKGDK